MMTLSDGRKVFEPGDYVDGIGVVDSNHCGFPWVIGLNGSYHGVIAVKVLENHQRFRQCEHCGTLLTIVTCDAISGNVLSRDEMATRLNNENYDYGERFRKNLGRRYEGELPAEKQRDMNCFQMFLYRWKRKAGACLF